jgi:hypothetical protein
MSLCLINCIARHGGISARLKFVPKVWRKAWEVRLSLLVVDIGYPSGSQMSLQVIHPWHFGEDGIRRDQVGRTIAASSLTPQRRSIAWNRQPCFSHRARSLLNASSCSAFRSALRSLKVELTNTRKVRPHIAIATPLYRNYGPVGNARLLPLRRLDLSPPRPLGSGNSFSCRC